MAYLSKNTQQMITSALTKLTNTTDITNVSPGSVARAMVEIIVSELGDFYSILDFNTQQNLLATASGRNLDLIGVMFNTSRKTLTTNAAIDAAVGSFYFYLPSPLGYPILIPNGTHVFIDNTTYVGQNFSYVTVGDTVIPTGYIKSWAGLRPTFSIGDFNAGANTITVIDPLVLASLGTTVYCTNPKAIQIPTTQESDASFRTRIAAAIRAYGGGTLAALRLAALNISGVRDVTMRQAPYGLGTVEALLVTDDNVAPSPLIPSISLAMASIAPAGIQLYVNQPELLTVSVTVTVIVQNDINLSTANISQGVTNLIYRFLNAPLIGTTLVYNELIQTILNASDFITDAIITSYTVNGTEVLKQNYTPSDNQQLIPGLVLVSTASSS